MSHALIWGRPAPASLTGPRRDTLSRFRLAHVGLTLVHLAQALLVLLVAGDTAVAITHDSGGGGAAAPVVDVSLGALAAAYFVATALSHGLSASLLRRVYEADLRAGRNRIRWVGVAVSAPILMLLIALYAGLTDVTALVVIGAATLVSVGCGWLQEARNPPGRRATTMVPFWGGALAALVPWALVAGQILGAADRPDFVVSVFLSLFILWASFGVNQWLQYRRVGPWADYLHGEQAYLALSLVATSALAWQIVAGALLN